MRWSLLLLLVAIPRLAFAEPKVAVAPLDDDDGKVAQIVADVAGERAKLTKPARVEGAMRSLGVSVLSAKSLKKLRAKLDVDVVIYGSVEKDNGSKRVSLTFAGSNKNKPKLEVDAKNPKTLRKELEGKLAKRIAAAMEGSDGDDEEDEEEARREEERKREEERRKKEEEEERKREEERRAEKQRREEEEQRKRDEEERKRKKKRDDDDEENAFGGRKKRGDDDEVSDRKKRGDDDEVSDRKKRRDDDDRKRRGDDEDDGNNRKKRRDDDRKKRVADEDDEDGGRVRKRLDDDEDSDDEERPRKKRRSKRHVLTQNALWLDAGGSFARRTFTYAATGMMAPPGVGTAAAAGRLEAEAYPGAFSTLKGAAASIGIAASFGYGFGLGIEVPGTTVTAPIKNGQYSIGARYRFVFGEHSLAVGISYWRRHFIADRSGLMNPGLLDMPDVDYSAIAPGATLRIGVGPKISGFASLDLPLMLSSGPLQEPASYGGAKILAADFRGGTQIMLADRIALQLAAEFLQIGLTFTGQPGSMASARMVQSATERSVGLSATIGITY